MANTKFYAKQDNTGPPIRAVLTDALGNPVDLSGASGVDFHMASQSGVVKVNAAGVIVNALGAVVEYAWQAGDLDTVGTFQAEFEVDFGGGLLETFPNDRNGQVIVAKKVA